MYSDVQSWSYDTVTEGQFCYLLPLAGRVAQEQRGVTLQSPREVCWLRLEPETWQHATGPEEASHSFTSAGEDPESLQVPSLPLEAGDPPDVWKLVRSPSGRE